MKSYKKKNNISSDKTLRQREYNQLNHSMQLKHQPHMNNFC